MDMYEVIRNHERVAARLKEETARAKLAASDKEFQQKLAPKTNKRKRKPKAKAKQSEDAKETDGDLYDEDDSEDMDDGDDDDDDDDAEETLHDRREAKLAELRVEVEEAKHAIAPVDQLDADALREQHLADTILEDDGPKLIRKSRDVEAAASSLIANLTSAVTPPHDFSEKLELANRGKVLFPVAGTTDEFRWAPPEGVFSPNDGAFTVDLNDFDVARAQTGAGNNTIAIKVRAFQGFLKFFIPCWVARLYHSVAHGCFAFISPLTTHVLYLLLYVIVHGSSRRQTLQYQHCDARQ